MRRVILAITLVIQVACGQLLLNDDERGEEISRAVNELMLESSGTSVRAQRLTPQAKHDDGEHHHHHTHVTRLDVTCDENVMRVNLEFDHPFDGVVFSKGHFGNPRCRFVSRDSARSDFSFIVSPQECGTIGEDRQAPDCDGCDDREAIIVIQNEEAVQEIWDSAKRIRCPKPKKIVKKVSFNPFEVAKLEVDELKTEETAEVECWMNIQVGNTPCGTAINGRVKIGDELSAVVYIKDNGANYDIKVKDCFAHDRADLLEKNVTSLRLSDERGCPTKKKLMGFFTRTKETCSSGADLVAFAPINAFKFADREDVYLTCVVELCPGGCEGHCPQPSIEYTTKVPPPAVKTTPFVCTPGSRDPRCPTPAPPTTQTTPFVCYPGSRDPRCPTPPTTQFVCTPGSRDPRCPTPAPITTQTTPFVCRPGSRDPRCPTPAPITTQTTPFVCRPGSRDPRCPTPAPPTIQTTPFVCRPGSRDPRCPTPAPITTQTTPFVCRPGSRDPRCPTPAPPTTQTTPFVCRPGSRDPRCPTPAPITTQTTPFVCRPGSRDPRCPTPAPPTTQTTPFVCYPGSRDPRCPTPAPPTTQFVCTPGSRDPRCPTPAPPTTPFRCTAGSRDPRCPTPAPPTTQTTPFVCYPGSRDPRCPTPAPPTTQFVCTPGSRDPRCSTPAPPTTPFRCTAGSQDSRCVTPAPKTSGVKHFECDINPNLEGCAKQLEDRPYHAFHAWQKQQPVAGRGRRIYNGERRSFSSQERQKRSVNKTGETITLTLSTGFHTNNN